MIAEWIRRPVKLKWLAKLERATLIALGQEEQQQVDRDKERGDLILDGVLPTVVRTVKERYSGLIHVPCLLCGHEVLPFEHHICNYDHVTITSTTSESPQNDWKTIKDMGDFINGVVGGGMTRVGKTVYLKDKMFYEWDIGEPPKRPPNEIIRWP